MIETICFTCGQEWEHESKHKCPLKGKSSEIEAMIVMATLTIRNGRKKGEPIMQNKHEEVISLLRGYSTAYEQAADVLQGRIDLLLRYHQPKLITPRQPRQISEQGKQNIAKAQRERWRKIKASKLVKDMAAD